MRDLIHLPTFADADVFHVVVESPRGAAVKLKYNPSLGAMSISRPKNGLFSRHNGWDVPLRYDGDCAGASMDDARAGASGSGRTSAGTPAGDDENPTVRGCESALRRSSAASGRVATHRYF
jgi:hypothetical protein